MVGGVGGGARRQERRAWPVVAVKVVVIWYIQTIVIWYNIQTICSLINVSTEETTF